MSDQWKREHDDNGRITDILSLCEVKRCRSWDSRTPLSYQKTLSGFLLLLEVEPTPIEVARALLPRIRIPLLKPHDCICWHFQGSVGKRSISEMGPYLKWRSSALPYLSLLLRIGRLMQRSSFPPRKSAHFRNGKNRKSDKNSKFAICRLKENSVLLSH